MTHKGTQKKEVPPRGPVDEAQALSSGKSSRELVSTSRPATSRRKRGRAALHKAVDIINHRFVSSLSGTRLKTTMSPLLVQIAELESALVASGCNIPCLEGPLASGAMNALTLARTGAERLTKSAGSRRHPRGRPTGLSALTNSLQCPDAL